MRFHSLRVGLDCLRCSPPGCRPGSRVPFFASPKKGTKERRPDCRALRATPSLGLRRREKKETRPRFARCSDNFFSDSAVATPSSARHTGGFRSGSRKVARGPALCRTTREAMRSEPSCLPRWRRRGAQQPEGCRPQAGRTKLSEHRWPKAKRASFLCSPSGCEHRSAPGTPGAGVGSPFFAYFLWRSKESRSAAGTTSRRAATQRTK